MSKAKEGAGKRAAEFVKDGMTVGLGTGSTVFFTLVELSERIRQGMKLRGVPTSIDTQEKCEKMGIPLVGLDEVERLDLTIDGADEIDANFQMIKGGGGALLREKVVARASAREVIVVDPSKVVERLGLKFLLPLEVVPFARSTIRRELLAMGADPILRIVESGSPFLTDNGNEILDTSFKDGIADPESLERKLLLLPGLVECGLFVNLAHELVIGYEDGSTEVRSKPS